MTVPLVWKSMPYFPSSPFFNKCLITLQVALPYRVAMGVHHSDLLQENMLQTAEWTATTPVDQLRPHSPKMLPANGQATRNTTAGYFCAM